MQIAGSKCKVCERNIVFANDGKFCAHCGTVMHLACEPQTKCSGCGQLFQQYEPSSVDPMRDALIPQVLRSRSGGPVFAIVAAVFMLIVVLLIYYGLLYGLENGH